MQITPTNSDTNEGGHQVDLTEGLNEIDIQVSEVGGDASTTYSVQVTRMSPQPQPDPTPDPGPTPSLADDCREGESNGRIANCIVTDFAVVRVKHDGIYTIDWSEWDEEHPEVGGYTIVLQGMLYMTVYEDGEEVDVGTLSDVYESCEFAGGQWNCEGPVRSQLF